MRATKIICTIGPKSLNKATLLALSQKGMSIVRLNGSHSNLAWHLEAIQMIHELLPCTPILLDIPGRKIRTLQLEVEPKFAVGDIIILTTDISHNGLHKVPVNYPNLHKDVAAGNVVMADDGTLCFTVMKVDGHDIFCRAETEGCLKSKKGINVPFVNLNTKMITERDHEMINFSVLNKVDFIGLSFVESAEHINLFRKLIDNRGPKIVAKVENQGGFNNLDEISKVADAIMIDRGDLSVETELHDVIIKQKKIIEVARKYGTPVIVATELLHTMIENSYPTKAEISDISNAVLDGCSLTMLSGETAVGAFPLESVETMCRVIDAAESYYQENFLKVATTSGNDISIPDAMSKAVPILCRSLSITKIIAITRSGFAAKKIAAHRLPQPIIAVSDDISNSRSFNLIAGTKGVYSDIPFSKTSSDHIIHVLEMLWLRGEIDDSDLVLVSGISYPTPDGRMNSLQVHSIGSLSKARSWSKYDA